MLIAGGGSGGSQSDHSEGGGGGAGGLISGSFIMARGTLPIIIGAGGVGVYNATGNNGQNSTFNGLIAYGGGGGGSKNGINLGNGNNGGSGGGHGEGGVNNSVGLGVLGQGVNGGVNTFDGRNGGGLNYISSITGISQTYSQNGISFYESPLTYGSGGTGTGNMTSESGKSGLLIIRHKY